MGRKCQIQKNRKNSHSKFSQTVTSKHWRSRKLSDRCEQCWQQCKNTPKYRPSADNALMRWIVRHAAWLIPRFRGSEVHSPFYRAMGGPYRGKLVEFGKTVLAHLPEVGKGSGNPAPKLADRWKSDVWLGKSDLTDEHLVRTE